MEEEAIDHDGMKAGMDSFYRILKGCTVIQYKRYRYARFDRKSCSMRPKYCISYDPSHKHNQGAFISSAASTHALNESSSTADKAGTRNVPLCLLQDFCHTY